MGCQGAPPAEVDIVAHSMGAFSARWFARFVMAEKVRTIVTLAGANHGTDMLCGLSGVGNRQMCPAYSESGGNDNIQRKLNGTGALPVDETPFGLGADRGDRARIPPDGRRRIVYFTVRLDPDEWIVPADSAVLDGAGGKAIEGIDELPVIETSSGNFLFQGPTSHDGLPSDPELIQFVFHLLR